MGVAAEREPLPASAPESRTDWVEEANSGDMGQAVNDCEFPIVVWTVPGGVVALANEAAAQLFGVPLSELVGRRSVDLLSPREEMERVMLALTQGGVHSVRVRRRVRAPGGELRPVWVWSRAIEVDDVRAAVSIVVPVEEVPRLGRDPGTPWRSLAPVAIGSVDRTWRIERISRDVRRFLGWDPSELVGSSLPGLVSPDDVARVRAMWTETHGPARAENALRVRHRNGSWVVVCLLAAPSVDEDSGRMAFVLLGPSAPAEPGGRAAQLERHLRRIAAEVRAAGVLEDLDVLPQVGDFPQLSDLTSRQWEILSRLLRGDRVPAIAAALYLSPSTVRNHLVAIFRKFGVHSQTQLIDLLRGN